MHEDLVPFEMAVIAKEKGFDWECNSAYLDLRPYKDDFSKEDFETYVYKQNHNAKEHRYSAPSLYLLEKWMRKNYHLHVRVACNNINSYFPMVEKIDVDGTELKGPNVTKNKKTYEGALEEGIYHALTLIP